MIAYRYPGTMLHNDIHRCPECQWIHLTKRIRLKIEVDLKEKKLTPHTPEFDLALEQIFYGLWGEELHLETPAGESTDFVDPFPTEERGDGFVSYNVSRK